jgi:hypothetical protein
MGSFVQVYQDRKLFRQRVAFASWCCSALNFTRTFFPPKNGLQGEAGKEAMKSS